MTKICGTHMERLGLDQITEKLPPHPFSSQSPKPSLFLPHLCPHGDLSNQTQLTFQCILMVINSSNKSKTGGDFIFQVITCKKKK